MKRKNFFFAGARTHKSDYFHAVQYLGCKPVVLNLFYQQWDLIKTKSPEVKIHFYKLNIAKSSLKLLDIKSYNLTFFLEIDDVRICEFEVSLFLIFIDRK